MGFFARLFGRDGRKADQTSLDGTGGITASTFHSTDAPASSASQVDWPDQSALEAIIQRVVAPIVNDLQALRRQMEAINQSVHEEASPSAGQQGVPALGVYTVTQDVMERAIESALAHLYQLLRGREEFKTQPVFLMPTSDGNTALPLDPTLQHFLIVMHPLYPHMYTTMIVLPGTFTRVDRLGTLPTNGVRVHSLHINERKAAPGFVDALKALHRANSENLFLGRLTPRLEERNGYLLEYFRCTRSDMRKADPERYPDDQMMFFSDVPEPLIFRQRMDGVDDVFSALESLTQSAASSEASVPASDPMVADESHRPPDGDSVTS